MFSFKREGLGASVVAQPIKKGGMIVTHCGKFFIKCLKIKELHCYLFAYAVNITDYLLWTDAHCVWPGEQSRH